MTFSPFSQDQYFDKQLFFIDKKINAGIKIFNFFFK